MSSESARRPEAPADEESARLVSAICHEIGNMVAAIRLQAHFLDDDLAPKALAATSVEIDDLAARMSAMLALVRPLLQGPRQVPTEVVPSTLLAAVRQSLEDHGGRGTKLRVECEDELPTIVADADILHHLLITLVFGALEAAHRKGLVNVTAAASDRAVVLSVEDDAESDDELLDWREHVLRGRPLTCAVADYILRKHDGQLEVAREGGLTRVSMSFPRISSAPPDRVGDQGGDGRRRSSAVL